MSTCSKFTSKNCSDLTYSDLVSFCELHQINFPEMKLVRQYLLSYGPCLIGLLEAQKYGNYELTLAMTKEIFPINFTTRATHYGLDTIGHIKNIVNSSKSSTDIQKTLYTFNRRKESGHHIPRKQFQILYRYSRDTSHFQPSKGVWSSYTSRSDS